MIVARKRWFEANRIIVTGDVLGFTSLRGCNEKISSSLRGARLRDSAEVSVARKSNEELTRSNLIVDIKTIRGANDTDRLSQAQAKHRLVNAHDG